MPCRFTGSRAGLGARTFMMLASLFSCHDVGDVSLHAGKPTIALRELQEESDINRDAPAQAGGCSTNPLHKQAIARPEGKPGPSPLSLT